MTVSPKHSPAPNRTVAASDPATWHILATVAAILGYVVWFYAGDLRRWWMVSQILVPEELIASWVDFDWSRFGVLDHLPVLAGAAVIYLVAGLTGWIGLQVGGVGSSLDRLEKPILSLAVGLNLWSLLTLVIGWCGGLHQRWLFGLVAGVVVAVAAGQLWRTSRRPAMDAPSDFQSDLTSFGRCALLLCVPLAVVIIWGGTLPATHFDVREYHLQVPKEWYQQGRISFLPHNVYGNMPLGAEMHAVLGMLLSWGRDDWWWGALIGKTVIAAFGPLGAAGIFVVGRRFLSSDAGAWGAFAYLSTPWVAHVSMTGLIDGVVAGYVILAFGLALRCVHWQPASRDSEPVGLKLLTVSGFLAGAAVACKYTALLFLVAPLGLVTCLIPIHRGSWKAAVLFGLGVVAGCGLWFGKNGVLARNPTYPLLYSVFGGRSWSAEKDARWTRAHGPPHDVDGNRFTAAQVADSVGLLLVRSDHHGPWLVPLAIVALWGWRMSRTRRLLLACYGMVAVAVVSWWLLTHRIDRFLVPVLPLVALGAGLGATWTCCPLWQRSIMAIGAAGGLATFLQIASPYGADNRFLIALSDLRLDLPRSKEQPLTRMNSGHRWLNEHVPPGGRVLLVGEAQVFDLEMPILYNTCFDDCIFELLMKDRSREERLAALKQQRITHVFVSWYELNRYRSPGNYGYSDYPTPAVFFDELVTRQRILRPVVVENIGETATVFEVVD